MSFAAAAAGTFTRERDSFRAEKKFCILNAGLWDISYAKCASQWRSKTVSERRFRKHAYEKVCFGDMRMHIFPSHVFTAAA